jgi:hypothetical protein
MRWLAMGRVNVKCLVLGHDDLVRHDSGRIFLECVECGRETAGWVMSQCGERETAPPPATREPDRRWSSILRSRFQTVEMR